MTDLQSAYAARMPRRIQRQRTKGWRMPAGAVYVGRPTMWGNRWQIGTQSNTLGRAVATVQEAVDLYALLMWPDAHHKAWVRERLAGHDLACWCSLCPAHTDGLPFGVRCDACAPCHADRLGCIANGLVCEAVDG